MRPDYEDRGSYLGLGLAAGFVVVFFVAAAVLGITWNALVGAQDVPEALLSPAATDTSSGGEPSTSNPPRGSVTAPPAAPTTGGRS